MNLPASAGSYSVETLHLSFASSNRLMRILRSIVGTQSLLVQSREANFAKRRSVGSEFVGDDYRRNEALTPKQFPQQPQRRGLVALGLDQDFENLALDGANLSDAIMDGVNVSATNGGLISQGQLDKACGNKGTRLPSGLTLKPCQ
jgi:hypothetical protein